MTRGFSPLRDLPALVWLIAIPLVSFAHPLIPEPRWLLVHLLLLGAVTHSIVVWSQHFADALLRTPSTPRPQLLALLAAGALAVMVGTQGGWWLLTLMGASAVTTAVVWHSLRLAGQLRRSLQPRFARVVHYYLAAAAMLPLGASLGVLLARQPADPWHSRLLLAHVAVNLLGWVGLTVAGTVVTLWPTILRTRMGEGTDAAIRRALPIMVLGVLVVAVSCLFGGWQIAAAGVAAYVVGAAILARPLVEAGRRKPPASHPGWSVMAGILWWAGCLVAWGFGLALGGSGQQVLDRFETLVPFLAAGFAAQVLLGALGYLVPTAVGGGGHAVRSSGAVLARAGALRVVAVNLGLVVCLLPGPSAVVVAASAVVMFALAAQLPLLVLAIRAGRRAKESGSGPGIPDAAEAAVQRRRSFGSAVAGIAVVALAVAGGVIVDPTAVGLPRTASAAAGVVPTGKTTTVTIRTEHMRFVPSSITVPVGDRLVIELDNTDADVHDLVLETGADTGRVAPGDQATLDVGVVGRDLDAWCSIVGHRQMGMTLAIKVTGGSSQVAHEQESGHHAGMPGHDSGDAPTYPHGAHPGDDFTARDAVLPRLSDTRVHRVTLRVREEVREVAPGVTQRQWVYEGDSPGPTLHGRVGDRFVVTLVNDGTMGHSVDFHAGALAPDRPMRTIAPGESLTYRFTATRAGIWMYHCSTHPMSVHIANGMFGAVVIEPPGLPAVDREYVLVQSEHYYGAQGEPVDADKVLAEQPDAVVFNGYANQYDFDQLRARVGERVRVWVLDAGPNRSTSFHVVGGQFDTVWVEGSYLLRAGGPDGSAGAQALALGAAQGGFVELEFPEAGHYPFVSHVMVDAERGAHGVFDVRR